jgi:hypothetical protein
MVVNWKHRWLDDCAEGTWLNRSAISEWSGNGLRKIGMEIPDEEGTDYGCYWTGWIVLG